MCLVYKYTSLCIEGSSRHKKHETDCSAGKTPTCKNISSISAETANWCWRKRTRVWISLFNRSEPVSNTLFKDIPCIFEAPFNTLQTFSGLSGFTTGWWGRYHSLPAQCLSSRWSAAKRGSTCLTAPYDSFSYQDFIRDSIWESCLATALKQVEIRPDEDGNRPLNTQTNCKRIGNG